MAALRECEMTCRRTGATQWTISSALAGEFLDEHGLRWDEWRQRGQLDVVKTGPHRTVYRLTLPCGEFYLKHFRIADWKAQAQNFFRPCKAELEWNAARQVAEAGLPTFETVALGKTMLGAIVGESFLITRAIADSIPLDEFVLNELSRGSKPIVRQRLATQLGRLTAQLHAAQIDHVDFHAGNILVRVDDDLVPQLSLIDLHAARSRHRLTAAQCRQNLANLNQFFVTRGTRTDRLRFRHAYMLARRDRAAERDELRRMEAFLREAAERGWNRADRAWRRGNRHVRKLDAKATRCRGVATCAAEWLTAIRDAPENLFTANLVAWCKRSGRHRVAEVALSSPAGPVRGFWKCIEENSMFCRIRGLFRESVVRHAWETGHAFLRRGIDTPKPLVLVENRSGSTHRQYLLTEAIANSVTVFEYLAGIHLQLSAAEQRRRTLAIAQRLAHQLRRLHDCRYDHRDLKFGNILVSTDIDQPARTWLLDLDAVKQWPRLPVQRAVQNLSRINVSSLQGAAIDNVLRLRFLRWYLGDRFSAEWKWWWRSIARRSRQKQQQNKSRGRPLT